MDPDPSALERVADRALTEVADGMRLGLGTGRAAEAFIRRLGRAVREGLRVVGVPTSERSAALARELGIALGTLSEIDALDVAFDGADEVAPDASLTKGRGGAMLRERVVAAAARRFVVLVTPDKIVAGLGEKCPLPVEVVPFAVASAARRLAGIGGVVRRRDGAGGIYTTDNGNEVLDLDPPGAAWEDPRRVDRLVRSVPGVVDTGFFFDAASLVLVGDPSAVREITPSQRS